MVRVVLVLGQLLKWLRFCQTMHQAALGLLARWHWFCGLAGVIVYRKIYLELAPAGRTCLPMSML